MSSNKLKLTDSIVAQAALPEGKAEAVLWDAEVTGFGLRIRPGGRTWIVAYRPAGAGRSANMKRLKLGTPGTIATAADARKLAKVVLGKVAAGADPAAERAEQKRREKARVADLLERYDRELERRQYVNRSVVIAGLKTRLRRYANDDIQELTGGKLAEICEKLASGGRLGAAEDFRSRCRAFLSWCLVKAKVIEFNPLAGYRRERATRADRIARAQHGRALSDDELKAVWSAADPATAFGRLVRFYVLTGCRRGEGAGLTWTMVDREARALDLPAAFVKQGRGHKVPIAPLLDELLEFCPIDARSDLVFASPKTGGEFSGWTKLVARLCKDAGVELDLHDLRRTFRTGLSRLGIDDETAELALGHARADLAARYNRDDAIETLRLAFEKWAMHVSKAVQ